MVQTVKIHLVVHSLQYGMLWLRRQTTGRPSIAKNGRVSQCKTFLVSTLQGQSPKKSICVIHVFVDCTLAPVILQADLLKPQSATVVERELFTC